jgi:hypothetical protein
VPGATVPASIGRVQVSLLDAVCRCGAIDHREPSGQGREGIKAEAGPRLEPVTGQARANFISYRNDW